MENSPRSVKRGFVKNDRVEFSEKSFPVLQKAGNDFLYLIDRGYVPESAATFVGNHYFLTERQRTALVRGIASSSQVTERRIKEIKKPSGTVFLDGFNTVITLEVALSGSLLICCSDETVKDLAGLHGTYRIVDKTYEAVRLILGELDFLKIEKAVIYLDRPVSNSGRLSALFRELSGSEETRCRIETELVLNPDKELYEKEQIATSDGIILDKCASWFNLKQMILERSVKDAWVFRFFR